VLAAHGVEPALAAGHSLGEWSAHVAAGTIAYPDALRAVKARGRAMQQAVPAGQGAMAAVLALDAAHVVDACAEAAAETGLVVQAANINSPSQTVISGTAAAVDRAIAICKAKGARRAVPLPVSAPFHCALMQPAQDEVARVLDLIALADPRIPVAANVTGGLVTTAAEARDALIRQVTGSVRWVDCVHALMAAGADTYVEAGPGKVLTGLMKQIEPAHRAFNVEDPESLGRALSEIR
jgi:[acyl-carrier-protein] S-malonyltransferase